MTIGARRAWAAGIGQLRSALGARCGGALVGAAIAGASCGGAPPAAVTGKVTDPEKPMISVTTSAGEPGTSCERLHAGVGPVRDGATHQGSSVALARQGKQLIAYVADADQKALALVEVASSKTIAKVELRGRPEQLLVLADGRIAVTLSDSGFVDVYEPTGTEAQPLEHRCRVGVPAGPFALASSADDSLVAVTSAFDPALTVLDGKTLVPSKAVALARSPRGVLVDGTRAFVSHLSGANLSVVELGGEANAPLPQRQIDLRVRAGSMVADPTELATLRTGSQAYALVSVDVTRQSGAGEGAAGISGNAPLPSKPPPPAAKSKRIVVPMVTVDPGDRARPSQFYYGPPPVAGVPKQAPIAVVVDPSAEKSLVTHVVAPSGVLRREECLLPRAAAFRSTTERLYVVCMGIDVVLELDARAADPMRAVIRRFDVPGSPTGIAVSETENVAIVAAQESGQIAKISLADGVVEFANLERSAPFKDSAYHLGRELFNRTDDPRITGDGVGCASCHPEGTEDGITWSTPEGPRQTLMLAGRLTGTAPYGWTRGKETLDAYIEDTTRRLGGGSLTADEITALGAYVKQLPRPPTSMVNVSAVERGHQVFTQRGCASCHVEPAERIPSEAPKPRDVGSKTEADWAKDFDSPALTGVGLTAPYYHDGRYKTLDAVLSDPNSKMGTIRDLSSDERTALKAYLESL